MHKNTVGIEFPKGHSELDQLTYNIDPQHGGHKMPCGDAPLPTDCALSWVFRNAMAIHDQMYRGLFPCVVVGEVYAACPKWDVDALLTAAVLAEVGWAAYMGTGGSQHFFRWGDSPDKKLAERVELVRKLDTGELGQQLGDHPDLVGLARVAAGSRPLKEKIELGRDWLMGYPNNELTKEAELARKEVEDGLSDAVVTWYGARLCFIRTKTLGQPSRGRSAAQKLGFDQGAHTVIQLSEDWTFRGGAQGAKYTITHKGHAPQLALRVSLNQCEDPCGSWGGPIPQPGQASWILGSPMERPSIVPPDMVVRKVCAALGVDKAYDFMRQLGTDQVPLGSWADMVWCGGLPETELVLGRAEFMHAFWGQFLGDGEVKPVVWVKAADVYWRPRGTTWLAVTQRALLAKLGRSESDFVAQLCAELGVEGGERTILVEIAKLKAKIDDRVAWDKRLKDGSATCKGSMRLSTGCGQCVRCKEEVLTLITKNTELENERNALRVRVEKASEQSEVARIKRSVSVYVEELQKLVE